MLNIRQLASSMRYAFIGLRYVYRHEQNFRIQVYASIVVVIFAIAFRVSLGEAIVLIMLTVFVLVLEIANAVVEKMMDVFKPRLNIYVKVIKDMMAAAVLITAIGSAAIAAVIFIPRILSVLSLN